MIDPKSFMEFFEKEFGVEFVDSNTGRNALEVLAENEKAKQGEKVCDNCRWGAKGDGKIVHESDIICVNDKSKYITDSVSKKHTCKLWECKK